LKVTGPVAYIASGNGSVWRQARRLKRGEMGREPHEGSNG
jgi:hypothetical protein